MFHDGRGRRHLGKARYPSLPAPLAPQFFSGTRCLQLSGSRFRSVVISRIQRLIILPACLPMKGAELENEERLERTGNDIDVV